MVRGLYDEHVRILLDILRKVGYTNFNRKTGNEKESTLFHAAQRASFGGKKRDTIRGTWPWSRVPTALA